MIPKLTELFFAHGIKIGLALAVLVGVFTWDHNRANRHRAEGAKKVVQASKEDGKRRNAKSKEIRSGINPSTAWKRLLSEYANDR